MTMMKLGTGKDDNDEKDVGDEDLLATCGVPALA